MFAAKLEITSEGNKDLEILLEAFENGEFDQIISIEKLGIEQGTSSIFGIGTKSVLKIEAVLKEKIDQATIDKLNKAMQLIMGESTKIITTFK